MKPIRYIPSKDCKTYTAHEMLEDVLTQIQDLREEFASTLDAMEDMITGAMKGDIPGLRPENPQETRPLTHLPGSAQTLPCRKRRKGCCEGLMSRDFRGITGLLPHYSTILLTTVSDVNAKRYFKQKSAAVYCR